MDEPLLAGDALLARAEAALAVPLAHAVSITLLDPARPVRGVRLPAAGLALTPAGTVHAAALGAAIELAAYLAVAPTLTAAQHAVTHHIATQHLRAPGAESQVEVSAELGRRSRSLAFVTVTAVSIPAAGSYPGGAEDGREAVTVAQSQVTKSIVSF